MIKPVTFERDADAIPLSLDLFLGKNNKNHQYCCAMIPEIYLHDIK
jgi:hypothetical protein